MPLTLKKLMDIKKQLDECSIKPFKGYIGICKNGFFEIKNQKQFDELMRETLLKEFDKIECENLQDSHPDVHKVIVDYLLENYSVGKKEVNNASK